MAQAEIDKPSLDAEELMHLAMRAMRENRDEDALLFLKHAIAQAPADGRLHYSLGALHAELGMAQRAISEITRATELNPELSVAHFQLGLLHVAGRGPERAQQAWGDRSAPGRRCHQSFQGRHEPLPQRPLRGRHRAAQPRHCAQPAERALNEQMERVIAQAAEAQNQAQEESEPETSNAPDKPKSASREPQHVVLAGYHKQEGKGQKE